MPVNKKALRDVGRVDDFTVGRRQFIHNTLLLAGAAGVASGTGWQAALAARSRSTESATRPRVIDFRCRPNTKEYMVDAFHFSQANFDKSYWGKLPDVVPLSTFVDDFRAAGINTAVFTGRQSSPTFTLSNDYIAQCAAAYPDLIVPIAGINPRGHIDALKETERVLKDLKFKGICTDTNGVYADDQNLYPIYYMCIEYDVPVIITIGPKTFPFGDPARFATVATDLPNLKIVLSHVIGPSTSELISLAYAKDNIYLDTSEYHFMPGFDDLMRASNTYLQDKIVYASGFPYAPLNGLKTFLEYPFDPVARDKILYQNAAKLLKI
jgi:predicted TIM-barrel fold metal-dependent hydrolase